MVCKIFVHLTIIDRRVFINAAYFSLLHEVENRAENIFNIITRINAVWNKDNLFVIHASLA